MTELFNFFVDLIPTFAEISDFLVSEAFVIGDYSVRMIDIFGVGVLGVIIGAKIIDLVVPV